MRSPEARTLLDAMNTGHRGTLATIHASSAGDALHRLASLVLRASPNLSMETVRQDVGRCLDSVVYVERDGARRRVRDVLSL